ncbi:unnamed protein product, partial [Choristocarpus tenellus]
MLSWWPGRSSAYTDTPSRSFDQEIGGDDTADDMATRPRLQAKSLAMLNAAEEAIYPTNVKIQVLLAQQNLKGSRRQRSDELHEALQQVIRVAALYRLLCIAQHESTRKNYQELERLLRYDLSEVVTAADFEKRRARFHKAVKRSGGLCNPDQLIKMSSAGQRSRSNPGGAGAGAGAGAGMASLSGDLGGGVDHNQRVRSGSGQVLGMGEGAGNERERTRVVLEKDLLTSKCVAHYLHFLWVRAEWLAMKLSDMMPSLAGALGNMELPLWEEKEEAVSASSPVHTETG